MVDTAKKPAVKPATPAAAKAATPPVAQAAEFKPNQEKLDKLKAASASIVAGDRGKGVPRRKKKVVHKSAATDDKKLQSTLKKLAANAIPGIDEVNMFKDNGEVIHFVNPKVQASLSSNIFAISGNAETKKMTDMLPQLMQQLGGLGGAENMFNLNQLAKELAAGKGGAEAAAEALKTIAEDEDVPQLVENFDEASKDEKI